MKKILYFIFIIAHLPSFGQSKITIQSGNPRTQISGVGGIGYNSSTGIFETISVQNMANLATLNTTFLADSASVVVGGFYAANDGGGGTFILNPTSSATAVPGMIVVAAGGGRWFRQWDGYHLNLSWFGSIGDGSTDNTTAEQAAFNFLANTEVDIQIPAVSYITKGPVFFNTFPLTVMGPAQSTTQFVGPIGGNGYNGGGRYHSMWMTGNIKNNGGDSGLTFINVNLLNLDTTTVIGANSVQPTCFSSVQDTGFVGITGSKVSYLSFINCQFSAPNGAGDGVYLDAYRNSFGGALKHATFKGCRFFHIHGSGIGILSVTTTGDNHLSDWDLDGNDFSYCGTTATTGWGWSISGFGVRGIERNNKFHHIIGIAIENVAVSSTTMEGNTVDSSYGTTITSTQCVPWTFNNIGTGIAAGQGNKMTDNRVLDSVNSNWYVYNQNNFTSEGNIIHMFNTSNSGSYLGGIGSVTNSSFSNDVFWMSGSESVVNSFQIFDYGYNGTGGGYGYSSNISFINEQIIGATGDNALIGLTDSTNNIIISNSFFGTHPATVVYNDGTSFSNYISGVDEATGILFNYGGIQQNIITQTSSYSVGISDYTILMNVATATVTLPTPASNTNRVIVVKHVFNSGAITLSGSLRSGDPTSLPAQGTIGATATLQCDGTYWNFIGMSQ